MEDILDHGIIKGYLEFYFILFLLMATNPEAKCLFVYVMMMI